MAKSKPTTDVTVEEPTVETTETPIEETVETVATEEVVAGHPSRDFYTAL